MSDLCERLRELAACLDAIEWEVPLCSRETCMRAANEIERLTRERNECRKLLRELVIAYHNNFHEQSSDKRMKLLPIMDRFIESARKAAGGK